MQKLCFCFCTLTSSRLAQSCLKLPAINWKLAKQLWFSEAGQREQRLNANLYAKQRFSHNKMWKPQFQTLTEDKLHLLNSVLVVCEDRAELPSLLTDGWWRKCIFRRLRLLIWLLCPPPQTADSHATTAAAPWSGWTASGTEAQWPTTHALLNTPWRRTRMWWVSPKSVLLVRVEAGEIR